jgi:hypothetical protein
MLVQNGVRQLVIRYIVEWNITLNAVLYNHRIDFRDKPTITNNLRK